jgi:hypothetical protein
MTWRPWGVSSTRSGPWLRNLVFVGGWAHWLHRYHPLAHPPPYQPLRTRDADVALSPTAPIVGNIRAALEQVLSGDESPPIAEYKVVGVGSRPARSACARGGVACEKRVPTLASLLRPEHATSLCPTRIPVVI